MARRLWVWHLQLLLQQRSHRYLRGMGTVVASLHLLPALRPTQPRLMTRRWGKAVASLPLACLCKLTLAAPALRPPVCPYPRLGGVVPTPTARAVLLRAADVELVT